MTAYDDLLTWASELGEGPIASLRSAAQWTASVAEDPRPAREIVADLEALGHLSVEGNRWRVVAPTLASLPNGGGNRVLVGGRTKWLSDSLAGLVSAADPDLSELADYLLEDATVDQQGPASWFLAFGRGAPIEALAQLGIRSVGVIADGQLEAVRTNGPICQPRTVRPGELVHRFQPDRNAPDGFGVWAPVSGDRQPGFYRYMRNNQRIHAEHFGDQQYREVDVRWAQWLGTPLTMPAVWLVPRHQRLYLAGGARPPLEIERALVARSGRLPTIENDPEVSGSGMPLRAYVNVTHSVATTVATLMNKELVLK